MPLDINAGLGGGSKKKDSGGLLDMVGKLGSAVFKGEADESDNAILKNVATARRMTQDVPASIPGAFLDIGQDIVKTAGNTGALTANAAMGNDLNQSLANMDNSWASFATDSDRVRKGLAEVSQADRDNNMLGKITGALGVVSPTLEGMIKSPARTVHHIGEIGQVATGHEALGDSAYGQAYEKGEVPQLLLEDLLNIGLAGQVGGGALGKVAGEGTKLASLAGKVEGAGAAIQRAPLAPIAKPLQAGSNAIETARLGGTALPKLAGLAEREIPIASNAARTAEKGFQWAGEVKAGSKMRRSGLESRAAAHEALLPEITAAENEAADLATAGNMEAAQQRLRDFDAGPVAEAKKAADIQAKSNYVEQVGVRPTAAPLSEVETELMGALDKSIATYGKDSPTGQSLLGEKTKILDAKKAESAQNTVVPKNSVLANFDTETGKLKAVGDGEAINPVYVPKAMLSEKTGFEQALKGLDEISTKDLPIPIRAMKRINNTWKAGALAANPAWQTGNATGNTIRAWAYGDVSPFEMAAHAGDARKLMKQDNRFVNQLKGSGFSSEAVRALEPEVGNAATRGIKKATALAYKGNEVIDDFMKSAVLEKKLRKAGQIDAEGNILVHDAATEAAVNEMVDQTSKAMGNFSNMSEFEKKYVKEVLPFYSWLRHTTKLAYSFPMEHPARAAWTMNLGKTFDPNSKEGAENIKNAPWLEGSVGIGNQRISLPGTQDVGAIAGGGLSDPRKVLASAGPIPQLAANAAGINLKSGASLKRDPKSMNESEKTPTLSEFAGLMTNMSPATRMVGDVLAQRKFGSNVATYDTRAPRTLNGKLMGTTKTDIGALPAPLFRYLTGINAEETDLKRINKAAKQEDKRTDKQARTYEKTVEKGKVKK